jgi:hypothetical protein
MFDVSFSQRDEMSVTTGVVEEVKEKRCRFDGSAERS